MNEVYIFDFMFIISMHIHFNMRLAFNTPAKERFFFEMAKINDEIIFVVIKKKRLSLGIL